MQGIPDIAMTQKHIVPQLVVKCVEYGQHGETEVPGLTVDNWEMQAVSVGPGIYRLQRSTLTRTARCSMPQFAAGVTAK